MINLLINICNVGSLILIKIICKSYGYTYFAHFFMFFEIPPNVLFLFSFEIFLFFPSITLQSNESKFAVLNLIFQELIFKHFLSLFIL